MGHSTDAHCAELGEGVQTRKASFILSTSGDFPESPILEALGLAVSIGITACDVGPLRGALIS